MRTATLKPIRRGRRVSGLMGGYSDDRYTDVIDITSVSLDTVNRARQAFRPVRLQSVRQFRFQ